MNNIEKIKAEIERLKNIAENNNASEYLRGQARICRVILAFIDSLPEEKPSEDLEEAAKRRKMGITPIGIIRMKVQELKWADVDKAGDLDIHPLEKDKYDYSIKQCDKIIAFIDNLPLTITKETPELNEAANDYQTTFNKTIGPFYHDDQKRAFIAGAKWQYKNTITFLSEVMFQDMKKGICGWGEIPINLTWQDIKKIVNIADAMLDDPKMRIAIHNHSEEEYYQKVLDEYNRTNGHNTH